ncbi:MAG: hypothetical protein KGL04_02820 [Elusimicrobia bacterium]|nr:hypothetical protein [Elusimicrobiota bacterium]MDE2313091.1 hypothetical protein [Elusimicrobiota bacterium]
MPEAISGEYVHLNRGIIVSRERFEAREDDGWKVSCALDSADSEKPEHVEIRAVLARDWRILGLEARRKTAALEISASCQWREGGWSTVIFRGGHSSRDFHIPMVEGLELSCPLAFFDGLLFRRLGLPQASQVRAELLEFETGTMETAQAHKIIERLDDERVRWCGQGVAAARYRVTDASGETQAVWVHPEGLCLFRRAEDGRERYRLLGPNKA